MSPLGTQIELIRQVDFYKKNTCQLLVRWKFTFVWSFCESISTAWHVACLLPPPKKRMPVTENSLNVGKKDKGPGRKAWKMCKRGEAAKGGTDTRGRRRCTFPFPLLWALFPTISSPSPFLFFFIGAKIYGPRRFNLWSTLIKVKPRPI